MSPRPFALPPAPPGKKRGSPLESSSSTEGTEPVGEEFAEQTRTGTDGIGVASDSVSEAAVARPRGVGPPQIKVGRLGKPNGLDGYLGIYIEPEDLSHIQPDSIVYVLDHQYSVRALRRGKKGPQVAFAEITTREAAEAIRGNDVYVAERRPLDEGEFWPEDLIGLDVRPNGGSVVAVEHGPSQARLVIERADSRFEVPFVDELVPVVDLDEGFVEVLEIEGLSEPSG